MPEYLKRTGRDTTDDILIRVPENEKHVSRLKGPASKRLGIDRGDITAVAAPLEGQMMIQYADQPVGVTPVSPEVGPTFLAEAPYYYSNGEWRPFSGTVGSAQGLYYGDQTVLAGAHDFVSWTHASGDAVLNLAAPTTPEAATPGVYAITAGIEVSGASDPGTISSMTLEISQPFIYPPAHGVGRAPGRYLQPPISGGGDLFLEMNGVAKLVGSGTDFFRVIFLNDDAVDWDILGSMSVTRIT